MVRSLSLGQKNNVQKRTKGPELGAVRTAYDTIALWSSETSSPKPIRSLSNVMFKEVHTSTSKAAMIGVSVHTTQMDTCPNQFYFLYLTELMKHWLPQCRMDSRDSRLFLIPSFLSFKCIYFYFIWTAVLPACMSVHHECAVPMEAERQPWVPWTLSYRHLWATMSSVSSGRATSVLNHWAISPVWT